MRFSSFFDYMIRSELEDKKKQGQPVTKHDTFTDFEREELESRGFKFYSPESATNREPKECFYCGRDLTNTNFTNTVEMPERYTSEGVELAYCRVICTTCKSGNTKPNRKG